MTVNYGNQNLYCNQSRTQIVDRAYLLLEGIGYFLEKSSSPAWKWLRLLK